MTEQVEFNICGSSMEILTDAAEISRHVCFHPRGRRPAPPPLCLLPGTLEEE